MYFYYTSLLGSDYTLCGLLIDRLALTASSRSLVEVQSYHAGVRLRSLSGDSLGLMISFSTRDRSRFIDIQGYIVSRITPYFVLLIHAVSVGIAGRISW